MVYLLLMAHFVKKFYSAIAAYVLKPQPQNSRVRVLYEAFKCDIVGQTFEIRCE